MVDATPSSLLTPEQIAQGIRLESIFMPQARAQRDAQYAGPAPSPGSEPMTSARFVHYTDATAALSILDNKRMWMRNTTCMADYREVQHGYDIMHGFFGQSQNANDFHAALDFCAPHAARQALALFDGWWEWIRRETYIISVSEHDSSEDDFGRLSMWRAFGGNATRVALIFDIPWYTGGTQALNVSFSPVSYMDKETFHSALHDIIAKIQINADYLRPLGAELIKSYVFNLLRWGVTCVKHPAFHEEREWRAIYSPTMPGSVPMTASTRVIGGVPQAVYEFPLDETVSPTLYGIHLPKVLTRIIIGPTQYEWAVPRAFVDALERCGVSDASARVHLSKIPLRS
jgi:hypothetical protein